MVENHEIERRIACTWKNALLLAFEVEYTIIQVAELDYFAVMIPIKDARLQPPGRY